MNRLSKILLIGQLAIFSTMNVCHAESFWDKTVDAVSDTATEVTDTVSDEVSSDTATKAQTRAAIDRNAEKALSRLFRESRSAKELYDKAAGYAVFDSRELAFLLKTGFGSGVAVNKSDHARTYMRMASAGANMGGGIEYIQVIFLFPTEHVLNRFIHDGWTAEGGANAVGGDESSGIGITLENGTKIYQLVDTGIMLNASIGGTKYWRDDDLN
jgi:lipid-binding SYLF domain-containing protein